MCDVTKMKSRERGDTNLSAGRKLSKSTIISQRGDVRVITLARYGRYGMYYSLCRYRKYNKYILTNSATKATTII